MNTIEDVIARWNSDEGKPYKGSLIDWKAYQENPESISCFCAQGQVLHLIGGLSPYDLMELNQSKADLQTAKLLDISISHAILLRSINDSVDGAPAIVLTEPEKILGPNAQGILAFWFHLDRMTNFDWRAARVAWAAWAARDAGDAGDAGAVEAARVAWAARAARDAGDAGDAGAVEAARVAWAARDAGAAWAAWAARAAGAAWAAWAARVAWAAWAARDAGAARDADIAYCAVAEIAGAKWTPEHSRGEYVFLPMFGFANLDSVLLGKEPK